MFARFQIVCEVLLGLDIMQKCEFKLDLVDLTIKHTENN